VRIHGYDCTTTHPKTFKLYLVVNWQVTRRIYAVTFFGRNSRQKRGDFAMLADDETAARAARAATIFVFGGRVVASASE
jgi:hypothetical protein